MPTFEIATAILEKSEICHEYEKAGVPCNFSATKDMERKKVKVTDFLLV